MSLKYVPSSESHNISAKKLFHFLRCRANMAHTRGSWMTGRAASGFRAEGVAGCAQIRHIQDSQSQILASTSGKSLQTLLSGSLFARKRSAPLSHVFISEALSSLNIGTRNTFRNPESRKSGTRKPAIRQLRNPDPCTSTP